MNRPPTGWRLLLRRILGFGIVAAAIGVFVVLRLTKPDPPRAERGEDALAVRVVTVVEAPVRPRVLGYGEARPERIWRAVAEVDGRIVERHDDLEEGGLVPAGTVLLKIDPTEPALRVAQQEAALEQTRAQIAELDVRAVTTAAELDIEKRSQALAKRELERQRGLLANGTVSETDVDRQERTVLDQERRVQTLTSTLDQLPSQRRALEANERRVDAQLAEARIDLERTTIAAPFDCRIAEVDVERDQFATRGQTLAVADAIDVALVEAQVPLEHMRRLVQANPASGRDEAVDLQKLASRLDLTAVVRLRSVDPPIEWPARFVRLSPQIDPEAQTLGLIVAVDDPYTSARAGIRPPLVKGLFCEVAIEGPTEQRFRLIPRAAVQGSSVFVVDDEKRLRRRAVTIAFTHDEIACVNSGLVPGETVVVSDPVPAIEGMLLVAIPDPVIQARLAAAVQEAERR